MPLTILAIVSFVVGLSVAGAGGRAERRTVRAYVENWIHGDYGAMYGLLSPASQREVTLPQFIAAYGATARTATLRQLKIRSVGHRTGNILPVQMTVRTRVFGTFNATLEVPLAGGGSDARIAYGPSLLFPGLREGELLTRNVSLAARGALLAGDGTPLAEGPGRTTPIPDVASEVVGTLGPIPPADLAHYESRGYPPSARVGISGLERAFESRLAGLPGGTLLAGSRVIASQAPIPGTSVKTTIDPTIERAAVAALAGRFAGMTAMDPRTGAILALAGVAYSVAQPPGSTMKIITSTAALQAGIVHLTDTFPILTSIAIDGFNLQNANGEACGGTLLNAFATSCNSVFAPLGAKLGGARLVSMAKRFGFDQPPTIPGELESTIPSASQIGDSLAVASSAIGQGMVQATALEMTDVAATIAMHGRRPLPTLLAAPHPRFVRVTTGAVARQVERMMVAVVSYGTGTAAAIPGVTVAGKTGTAELRNTATNAGNSGNSGSAPANSAAYTDAWFVGYAPVGAPRIVVGALFPNQGAGGGTAAPAVQPVLVAGLHRH